MRDNGNKLLIKKHTDKKCADDFLPADQQSNFQKLQIK